MITNDTNYAYYIVLNTTIPPTTIHTTSRCPIFENLSRILHFLNYKTNQILKASSYLRKKKLERWDQK